MYYLTHMEPVRELWTKRTSGEKVAIGFFVFALILYAVNPLNISLVLGNSMKPTFTHGDVVVYSEYIEMQEGNMVVYEGENGKMISHRLIDQRHEGVFIAQGDNNKQPDETLVTPRNYKGTIIIHLNTSEFAPKDFLWKYYPS